jgi:hypothetical protein
VRSARRPRWTRLLYLYPSDLTDELIDAICDTGVPYFDLSLQHVSKPLLRRMRRWGDGERFLQRIADIRLREPSAAFRSNFIVGYPGETEEDHDQLLSLRRGGAARLVRLLRLQPGRRHLRDGPRRRGRPSLMHERLAELREMQDDITARRRDELIGTELKVLVDAAGEARSTREAPEIDGVIEVPATLTVGQFHRGASGRCHGPRFGGRLALMPVDPSAVKTWANLVTVARVLIAPLMLVLIPDHPGGTWAAFGLWFVLCSSDGIDGYLARRHGATNLGAFLDPLADKILVLGQWPSWSPTTRSGSCRWPSRSPANC